MEIHKVKSLTESIIEDLSDNTDLSKILPKLEILSFNLKNKQFTIWLNNEVNGEYSSFEELPEYRIGKCVVFSNIAGVMGTYKNISISVEQFSDEKVRKVAQSIVFYEGILEIDNMIRGDKCLKKFLPAAILHYVNETLNPGWHSIEAWQVISSFTCKNVVDRFKSSLLKFILNLDEELNIGIDFDKMISNDKIERIMNTTINAGVVTTGPGSAITIENSNVVGGVNNRLDINESERGEIYKLIDTIEKNMSTFGESQNEVKDTIKIIKTQLVKEKPRKSLIKGSLNLLKEIGTETAALSAAPFIIEGIDKIIKLIS